MDCTPNSYTFCWVIRDINNFPLSGKFELKSPHFSSSTNHKWLVQLNFDSQYMTPSLHLLTSVSSRLYIIARFCIVGEDFQVLDEQCKEHVFSDRDKILSTKRVFFINNEAGKNDLLVGGNLMLFCKITVLNVFYHNRKALSLAQGETIRNLQSLLDEGNLADFTVTVKDQKFRCHKAILSSRSEFFSALLSHDVEETRNNELVLDDMDPAIFEKILVYLYTGQADIVEPEVFEMHTAADRYCIDRLKILCEEKLNQWLNLSNAQDVHQYATTHNISFLKKHSECILRAVGLSVNERSECDTQANNAQGLVCGNGHEWALQPLQSEDDKKFVLEKTPASGEDKKNVAVGGAVSLIDKNGMIHPNSTIWASTRKKVLSCMTWKLTEFRFLSKANHVVLQNDEFQSFDKDCSFEARWQIKIELVRVKSSFLPKGLSVQFLKATLICLSFSTSCPTVDYQLAILNKDGKEKEVHNGIWEFERCQTKRPDEYIVDMDKALQHLQGNDLVLVCRITYNSKTIYEPIEPISSPVCNLHSDLQTLLSTGIHSDVTVKAGDLEFRCHKAILMARSGVFARMLSNQPDATTLELNEMKPNALEGMITFIYGGKCQKCVPGENVLNRQRSSRVESDYWEGSHYRMAFYMD